jgi:threonine dehydratase
VSLVTGASGLCLPSTATAAAPRVSPHPPRRAAGGPTVPSVEQIQRARQSLAGLIRETPVWQWRGHRLDALAPTGATLWLKLELFQHTGTFKPRGSLMVMKALTPEQLARGVVAVSAGNHGMAVAYASHALGTHAKVVMPASANPARVARLPGDLGAEVVLLPDIASRVRRGRANWSGERRSATSCTRSKGR